MYRLDLLSLAGIEVRVFILVLGQFQSSQEHQQLHDLDFEIVHAYPCRNIVKLGKDMLDGRMLAQNIDTVLTAELVCQCR